NIDPTSMVHRAIKFNIEEYDADRQSPVDVSFDRVDINFSNWFAQVETKLFQLFDPSDTYLNLDAGVRGIRNLSSLFLPSSTTGFAF
ncbi:hypothetical protein KCU77_g23817, partial [Aureobasidium melanogenum]